jgi:hypothetical protein
LYAKSYQIEWYHCRPPSLFSSLTLRLKGKNYEQAIFESSLRVRESWLKPDLLRLGGSGGAGPSSHMKPKYALLIMVKLN